MWSWTCDTANRMLTGNGLPDHAVGTFPGAGNPNTIAIQNVTATMTLTPSMATASTNIGRRNGAFVYARNSVKFDPGTAGTCPDTVTGARDCDLAMGTGAWNIEALGQDTFDFGEDENNAHVQPTGEYHYHGIPEGMITNAGVSASNQAMVHVGWAQDGYPVYARYCYSDPADASSAIMQCTGSYSLKATPDANRPDIAVVPMGAFAQD